jgi:extradiol dioxygenase family protein
MQNIQPFHLAIPVKDIDITRSFYRDTLGLEEGRSSDHWVDFNFFGHQLVIHVAPEAILQISNEVDSKSVPVPHFGVVLTINQFESFSKRLIHEGIEFIIEPYTRFKGQPGEQSTMFFKDPSGNALEFKAFRDPNALFHK